MLAEEKEVIFKQTLFDQHKEINRKFIPKAKYYTTISKQIGAMDET